MLKYYVRAGCSTVVTDFARRAERAARNMLAAAASSATPSPPQPEPCTTDKDNVRARFYARGSTIVPQLGYGLRARNAQSKTMRLAVVMPWVTEATPSSTCAAYQAKPEMKAGADCKAFFTLPVSWPYWLASAGIQRAAIADFLIFREPGLPDAFFRGPDGALELPPNVKIKEIANLTKLYRTQMSSPRLWLNPDKVKDFKPTIGHVFEEHLAPYSHWAFGDVDVVYGDLRRFLTPHVLSHDIITFRCDDLCASMTKTVFAGQLTIFANNEWGRKLYRGAPTWEKVSSSDRYMFFDERSMPVHALKSGAPRVVMLINQLSDRLFTRNLDNPMRGFWSKAGVKAADRHMIWHGKSGRLLLVDNRPGAWCAVSEAALVHLQQHKFKHYGAMPAFDQRGFVFDRDKGILPAGALLNGSAGRGGAVDAAVLLTRPLGEGLSGREKCPLKAIGSNMERSMF